MPKSNRVRSIAAYARLACEAAIDPPCEQLDKRSCRSDDRFNARANPYPTCCQSGSVSLSSLPLSTRAHRSSWNVLGPRISLRVKSDLVR
jgi:hypothetical protein